MKKLVSSFVLAVAIVIAVTVVSEVFYTQRAQLYNEAVQAISETTGISEAIVRVSPVGDEIRWELDQSFGKNPIDGIRLGLIRALERGGR